MRVHRFASTSRVVARLLHSMPMLPGFATAEGTSRYRERFAEFKSKEFFRLTKQQLWWSSIGLGTYLGEPNASTDNNYVGAMVAALLSGINVIDTAINYRHQRSERNLGTALQQVVGAAAGKLQRDEVVVCTKAGYLTLDGDMPPDPSAYFRREYVQPGILDPSRVTGMNCMAPEFLEDQMDRSRKNLQLETIDVFYLHNPESQFGAGLSRNEFLARMKPAFQMLERAVVAGKIRHFGIATWNGLRMPPEAADAINLIDLVGLAREVAGAGHHFRFIQMPFSLAMHEGWGFKNQRSGEDAYTVFELAARLEINVVGSATLSQGNLTSGLPPIVGEKMSMATEPQNAIQFARSAPGITTSLVGMSSPQHVHDNMGVALHEPASRESWLSLFGS